MENVEDYLREKQQLRLEDDFIDCALNILKNLHRQSGKKGELKTYIPSLLEAINSHQNTKLPLL